MKSILESPKEVFSIKEAASLLGMSKKAIYHRIERGGPTGLSCVHFGGGRRIGILKQELVRFVNGWNAPSSIRLLRTHDNLPQSG